MDQHVRSLSIRLTAVILIAGSAIGASSCGQDSGRQAPPSLDAAALPGCSYAAAQRDGDGKARLALLVGVGAYLDESITDLAGPAEDVRSMHALLTGQGGYAFPEGNVCTLVDSQATGARFREAFDQALLRRARQGDTVVVFFAGHGTQLPDTNGDESDLRDEVLMLADSRSVAAGDLRDDEFAALLKPLRAASGNVVVILDSCNSGSATRAASSVLVPRFQQPRAQDLAAAAEAATTAGDESSLYFADSGPGLIAISAAVDGSSALEKARSGIFTQALVSVLSQVEAQPLTYRQLSRRVPPLVKASSSQIPSFEGDLDLVVFGTASRTRPVTLEVTSVGPPIELGGTLMPGLGRNAELRIFDSALRGVDLKDPAKSKAMVIVDESSGLSAQARVASAPAGAQPIKAGDLAVLVRPADSAIAMQVRLRPASEPGGIPATQTAQLKQLLAAHDEASKLITVGDQLADFEVARNSSGRYLVIGPEGQVRNSLELEGSVVENLWLHARQRAFLNLRTEGGGQLVDDQSLMVDIRAAPEQRSCVREGARMARDRTGTVIVPLCYRWNIHVKLAPGVATPLRLGGLILSTDGSVYGIPRNGLILTASPGGGEVVFPETFRGGTPLGINDQVLIFGTSLKNWVDWEGLTAKAAARDARAAVASAPPKGALHRALDRYLRGPGARGTDLDEEIYEDTAWTRTALTVRTEANPAFESTGVAAAVDPGSREYTIKEFDIRPYLPDDQATPLYKVLQQADWLARQNFSYKQHGWQEGSDAANLAKGIDCSRATWFAFTRAGLGYNSQETARSYLATADMVKDTSRMRDEFERCPAGANFETGDLLVYRDEAQGDGHIVMVIDPVKRIAWGSHGWDGNGKKFNIEPDTGVEYQLIKFKPDWKRWDRSTMTMRACWRYRQFTAARTQGSGIPGLAALGDSPCKAGLCKPANRPAGTPQ